MRRAARLTRAPLTTSLSWPRFFCSLPGGGKVTAYRVHCPALARPTPRLPPQPSLPLPAPLGLQSPKRWGTAQRSATRFRLHSPSCSVSLVSSGNSLQKHCAWTSAWLKLHSASVKGVEARAPVTVPAFACSALFAFCSIPSGRARAEQGRAGQGRAGPGDALKFTVQPPCQLAVV